MPRRGFLTLLAAAAELVETKRGKRANQRKTGGQRKEQRQHRIADHQSEQHEPENRINRAEDNCVTWDGLEILPAQAQRVPQVRQSKLSNDGCGAVAERV